MTSLIPMVISPGFPKGFLFLVNDQYQRSSLDRDSISSMFPLLGKNAKESTMIVDQLHPNGQLSVFSQKLVLVFVNDQYQCSVDKDIISFNGSINGWIWENIPRREL